MRFARGGYSPFEPDYPFPHVFRKWRCLSLLRLAQAPEHLDAVRLASAFQPQVVLDAIAHGLEERCGTNDTTSMSG
jgi:hypothetical protein